MKHILLLSLCFTLIGKLSFAQIPVTDVATQANVLAVNTQLGVINGNLVSANTQLGTINTQLGSANTQLGTANTNLVKINAELTAHNTRQTTIEVTQSIIRALLYGAAIVSTGVVLSSAASDMKSKVASTQEVKVTNVTLPAFKTDLSQADIVSTQ